MGHSLKCYLFDSCLVVAIEWMVIVKRYQIIQASFAAILSSSYFESSSKKDQCSHVCIDFKIKNSGVLH
jgi:hypothetical protein